MSDTILLVGGSEALAAAGTACVAVGYQVERVDTGPAALARLCRRDTAMPVALVATADLAGIGVAGLLRGRTALPGRADLPVWVVGGSGPDGSRPFPASPTADTLRSPLPAAGAAPAIMVDPRRPLLDPEQVVALRAYGPENFTALIQLFLDDWEERLRHIDQLLREGDRVALGKALHGWKGSSGSLGAARLHHLLAQCEQCCKTDDVGGVRLAQADLVATATATAAVMNAQLGQG